MTHHVQVVPIPPVPNLASLTYAVPEHLRPFARPGVRALVPLGRRTVTAIVLSAADGAPRGISCRDVCAVLDQQPIVSGGLMELARWMADYYAVSLSEVLSLAVGRGLTTSSKRLVELLDAHLAASKSERDVVARLVRAGRPLDTGKLAREIGGGSFYRTIGKLMARGAVRIHETLPGPSVRIRHERIVEAVAVPNDDERALLFERAPKRRRLFEHLLQRPGRRAALRDLARRFPRPSQQLQALAEAGLVRLIDEERYRAVANAAPVASVVELTDAQRDATAAIAGSIGDFRPFLLHGVTASGKTEIYLSVLGDVLDRGLRALVLVPEISLTHQVVARLIGRFGPTVAVLHSELGSGERWDEWRRIGRGEAQIVVGARSAVLAPVEKLGAIIVDEEHDGAYKQGEGPRYNGRDVAVMRARLASCPVVLGSATPSMESWHHATQRREHRYNYLHLPNRVTTHPLPSIEVVDLRGRDIGATGGISDHLARLLTRNLADGNQSLLFINRRGYAANLQCYECGEILECGDCSVGMTLHRHEQRLRCHHCDASRRVPERCPSCGRDALVSQGFGTERLETTLRALLPSARVARLDRDTASRKGSAAQILDEWRAGRTDVLVGTQMVTKGHDVGGVTLVGVVLADLSLGLPDFRAGERTFQLLSQVAGRAGRGSRRGRVVVQTYRPDHFAIASAARHDYQGFAEQELSERRELGYPPFSRMVLLRIEGKVRERTLAFARETARLLLGGQRTGLIVRGPAPSPIERVKGRWRYQIQLRGDNGLLLRRAAADCKGRLGERARRGGIRLIVDVDPIDIL